MATYDYKTVSGHSLSFDVDEVTLAFLERLGAMVEDRKAKASDLIALGYGSENPFLDHDIFPGRGAVTPAVLKLPAYDVMADMIFRKEMAQAKIDPESVGEQYTMSVAEAAAHLGVSISAVTQAIAGRRIGAWKKGGKFFLDPGSLHVLHADHRPGPRPRSSGAGGALGVGVAGGKRPDTPVGKRHEAPVPAGLASTLHVTCGAADGKSMRLRSATEMQDVERLGKGIVRGRLPQWSRVVVMIKGHVGARALVIERSDEPNLVEFGPFSVRGNFTVTKINDEKRAATVYRETEVQ